MPMKSTGRFKKGSTPAKPKMPAKKPSLSNKGGGQHGAVRAAQAIGRGIQRRGGTITDIIKAVKSKKGLTKQLQGKRK